MSKQLQFDPHQFADRRKYPVSVQRLLDGWVTPGIDFADYARMSTHQHKQSEERRLPTPDWAMNDKQLRELLVVFMEDRAGYRKAQTGELFERLERAKQAIIAARPRIGKTLKKLCDEYVQIKNQGMRSDVTDAEWNASKLEPRFPLPIFEKQTRMEDIEKRLYRLQIEIEGIDTYLRITQNGSAEITAAIVYLYYRAGLDSVGVGAELGLKPPHVRKVLWKLHDCWRKKFGNPAQRRAKIEATMFDAV